MCVCSTPRNAGGEVGVTPFIESMNVFWVQNKKLVNLGKVKGTFLYSGSMISLTTQFPVHTSSVKREI